VTSRRRACGRVHIDGYEAKIMAIGHLISSSEVSDKSQHAKQAADHPTPTPSSSCRDRYTVDRIRTTLAGSPGFVSRGNEASRQRRHVAVAAKGEETDRTGSISDEAELCAQSRTKRRHQTSAYGAPPGTVAETAATLWPDASTLLIGYPFAHPVHVRVGRHGSAWPGRRRQLGLVGRPLPCPLLRSIPHRTRLHVRRGRGGRLIARPDHHRAGCQGAPHDPSGLRCAERGGSDGPSATWAPRGPARQGTVRGPACEHPR
jgi:hypothetical protein